MAISKVILNNDVQIDITDTTATQGQVASTAYYYGADGVKKQGSYVVPSAVTQATPTISVNSSTGLITASATQSAGVVSAGTKSATEQLSTQAAQTLYPSTTDQTISSGKYLTGTQTFKGVLLTNLSAGNIKKDVVVKVGDSADDDRITSVTGTYEGGGSSYTLMATDTATVNTTSTSATSVKNISFSTTTLLGDVFFVRITDQAERRNGYFYQSYTWVMRTAASSSGTGTTVGYTGYTNDTGNKKYSTTQYGVYANGFTAGSNTFTINIVSRYNSGTGTIDGTYDIEIYKLDMPA